MTQDEQEINGHARHEEEALAIIGLSTKFPGDASSTQDLWKYLLRGRNAHTPFPEDRLGHGHYHPDPEHGGTHAVQGGHFMKEDPAYFDAPFFSITKGEAVVMDPQQRMTLESVYLALENSGLSIDKVASSNTSVFVSGFNHDHLQNMNADPETTLRYRSTGLTNSMLSNRVSWFFDLKGPSATLDTACSSSMVALHLGCQSLRTKETSMAVVSGVTVIAYPGDLTGMSYQGFLGQKGKCFSFDHRADGYARGEGVGTVIVKRISDAIRDGDTIRAVIRGSGVNQDGRTPGLTLPDSGAQERLIKSVYASAGLNLQDTAMVEAHGTGTTAGDPIEASAIARAFAGRKSKMPLFVGAIKSNTGHLEGAAGVAGVIKAILVLESGIIPPNANFEKVNPKIPAKKWNLQFPTQATPWPTEGLRRISVNSFGVGGTNGHTILDDAFHYLRERGLKASHKTRPVVPTKHQIEQILKRIEEFPHGNQDDEEAKVVANGSATVVQSTSNGHSHTNGDINGHANGNSGNKVTGHVDAHVNGNHSNWGDLRDIERPSNIVLFSSFDEGGLRRVIKPQIEYLKSVESCGEDDKQFVKDYAFSMSRRSNFNWRGFALGKSVSDLIANITTMPKAVRARGNIQIGYVFTGQGAQWYAMGRELLCFSVFKASMDEAAAYFQSLGAEWSLQEELSRSKAETKVNQALIAQPACTAIQVAIVELLRSWGVYPSRVIGHSSGEIAAAFCAGKLCRESAWKVAYYRGLVSDRKTSSKGAMLAAGLSKEALEPYIEQVNSQAAGELTVACINSPKNSTVSGDEHKIDLLRLALDKDGVFARKLAVANAYHSSHMKELAEDYRSLLIGLRPSESHSRAFAHMFSTVTGTYIEESVLDADYWVRNLVSPVRFAESVSAMCFTRTQKGQASLRANANAENVFADILIEVGPHGALQSAIKDTLTTKPGSSNISSFFVLNRTNPSPDVIMSTVAHLITRGYPLDVEIINKSADEMFNKAAAPSLLVDLPGYQFNHSQKLYFESRISKNHRLRKHERHDLFGAPSSDWNAETPKWRNFIRTAEQPWLRDHVVTNAIVYPGVGYLIAAVEASRQIADPTLKVAGFRLRDCHLKRAMIIPDNKDGIEMSLSMSRMDESSTGPSFIWRKFTISSYNAVGDDWVEHCTGYIATDYETPTGPVDNGRQAREEAEDWKARLAQCERSLTVSFDINRVYENLVTTGLAFGPLFRNVSAAGISAENTGEIIGTVTVPQVAEAMPKGYASPHLMHPATMDSMLHFALAGIMNSKGMTTLESPMVPTFIKDVWISADIDNSPGHQYRAYGKAAMVAYEKYESDVLVWDRLSSEARISLRGIRTTPLDSVAKDGMVKRKLCHEIKWVPYLDLITNEEIAAAVTKSEDGSNESEKTWYHRLQLATVLLVTDALSELGDVAPEGTDGHFLKYFHWMQHIKSSILEDKISIIQRSEWEKFASDETLKAELFAQIENHNANGKLAVRMGRNIPGVLRKKVDPLHLMFGQDDLLDHVYGQVAYLGNLPKLQKEFLNIAAENASNLKVLEVGAGTGSSTHGILDGLAPISPESDLPWSVGKYTFTDISSAFFEKAREKFKRHQGIMEYKVLDAEKDPEAQGFDLGSYDFVVAQNVIHATADLVKTLSNIRKLLKPGGRLLLQEGTRQDYWWSGIAFGQLPGWWMGVEPIRQWSPWVSSSQWNDILIAAGYTGFGLEIQDSQDEEIHTQSLFIAKTAAVGKSSGRAWEDIVLATASDDQTTSDLVSALTKSLQAELNTKQVSAISLKDLKASDLSHSLCISLVELDKPVLSELTKDEYENIKEMLTVCKGLLWIHGDMVEVPELGMILGLLRSNRWERDLDDANLITLSISRPRPASLIDDIVKFTKHQFAGILPSKEFNGEYILKDGKILTSRLHPDDAADNYLSSKFNKQQPVMTALRDAGRPLKLSSAVPGMLDKLEWVTDPMYLEPLEDTQVEVDIKAVGLNFRDLMIAMGEHMAYSMGCEAAGVISRVGTKVTDVKIGDRVVYICGLDNIGCFHTFGRVDQSTVVKIPEALSYEVAAGLPVVYATVIYGLREAGRLLKGEKILIHAAAGGVGQAAIHYAKHIGAEIFATVSTIEKRDLLVQTFGIPKDHIFSSRDVSFVKGIMRATDGKGVDVVLNSLSGEALRRTWDLIAPFGRFVEIGKKDAQGNGKVDLRPFLQNVTMTSVDLVTMMKHRPQLIKMLTEATVKLWKEGVAKAATPTKVMGMDRVQEGLQILQSGKGVGKMIFVPHPEDVMPITPATTSPFQLRSDATYVLGGGLGGMGRSIASWMASRGARHFVFLSSSGNITDAVAKMRTDLETSGCSVNIFKCDVSDKEALKTVVEKCAHTLPPIKGVIQGAMKLLDCMFENMPYETFQTAVKPKVQGSWNLHDLLPKDMDHFIMLSSATGVLGNRGQVNYAAGNTYQDMLAYHRRSLGLPASTIDLGTILSVGYVAENLDRVKMARHLNTVLETIREEEVHVLMEYLLDPRANAPAQVVSGLTTLEAYRQRGAPPPTYLSYPLFTQLCSMGIQQAVGGDDNGGPAIETRLQAAETLDEASGIVCEAVVAKLASLLSVGPEDINQERSVSANGVDSLVAMELRTWCRSVLKADVPMLEITGTANIHAFSKKLAIASTAVNLKEESSSSAATS
ncbi:iterative type I polyketide synthase [Acrodontium crateriforme]|uniref:Iterative type I polyketide synthase n=1 Tax=Acrodontium crateriforme TaxID=150365 RepID=A0AAQ3R496_9PEZI|nr:iterative type I polyketide synthase [Acrodontium crateriforme]